MLNLILASGRFNLCDIMSVGAIKDAVGNALGAGKTDIASTLAKTQKVADKQLSKSLEVILGE